jgi:hypothetical protein
MRRSWQLDRRTFLRGVGVAIALPLFEAMRPVARATPAARAPMRLVCVGNPLGMLPDCFFPETPGSGYKTPELLEPLEAYRGHFTVCSHLDHDQAGGHRAVHSFLSGIKENEASDRPERNISVDQRAAEFVGSATRFPSLVISPDRAGDLACRLSWTRNGINVPPLARPNEVFRALFIAEDAESRARKARAFALDGSILDAVMGHAKSLELRLGRTDREKLNEYLTAVREVETKLAMSDEWLGRPKPKVDMPPPTDGTITTTLPAFYDLLALALQTDSTRVATLGIPGSLETSDLGLSGTYHGFSHHGKAEVLRQGLLIIEKYQMTELARFLGKLKSIREPDGSTLLDRTMVLFGSGMGNGSSHSNKDLPILLAGGGFRHGEHKVYPQETRQRVPLCNLYVSMLQRFGLEVDQFNTSTGTLGGLEVDR